MIDDFDYEEWPEGCDYCGGDVTFDGPCYCDEDEDEEDDGW